MIDLETGGLPDTPSCPHGVVILSIGACTFNPYGGVTDRETLLQNSFYVNINPKSCEDIGLVWDPRTQEWWSSQSDEARTALNVEQRGVWSAIGDFISWIQEREELITGYWANSPSFDMTILRRACKRLNRQFPVDFWDEHDVRTIRWLAGLNDPDTWQPNFLADSVAHNALDDAISQALLVQYCIQYLGLTRNTGFQGITK